MLSQDPVQIIELTLDQAKEKLKDVDALDALMKNKNFQHLIKRRFLQEEPVRLVHLLQDPAFQTPEKQASLHKEMEAIAGLLSWLNGVQQLGEQLRADVSAAEEELELLRREADNA